MLNSLDTMRRNSVWFTCFYLILTLFLLSFSQTETEDIFISSPTNGMAVQGLVEINGKVNPDNFEGYTLSFYLQDSTIQTAFLIEKGTEAVEFGKLGEWETNNITDDTYVLELRVSLTDGNELVYLVDGIRVRNYTAIETSTPEPETAPTEVAPTQTEVSEEELFPTPDMSPPAEIAPNPAEISFDDIQDSMIRGVIIGAAGLVLLIIYAALKNRE